MPKSADPVTRISWNGSEVTGTGLETEGLNREKEE